MARILPLSPPAARRGSRRGFTFIEILATMSLLAIVLPSVMSGISLSLSAAELARQQAEASTLARGKLADLLVDAQWDQAQQAGDFAPEMPQYQWMSQLSPWGDGLMWQLDVAVTWQQQGRPRSVLVSTLVPMQTGSEP